MKFVSADPKNFHLYLVGELYENAVVAEDNQFFRTTVHVMHFEVSPRFLSEEFGLNNS